MDKRPNNVHDLMPKGGHVGRIEDPDVAPEVESSSAEYNKAAQDFLEKPVSKKDQYGIEFMHQIVGQLDAQEHAPKDRSYKQALVELSEGNTKNIELLKETRKVLLDLREIAIGLSNGSVEDKAVITAIQNRLDEITPAIQEYFAKEA